MGHGLDHTGAHPHRTHRHNGPRRGGPPGPGGARARCLPVAGPATDDDRRPRRRRRPRPGRLRAARAATSTRCSPTSRRSPPASPTRRPIPAPAGPTTLKLDAWAPANDTATKRPAIVWGFPGAFVGGSRQGMNAYAQDSARRGYVGITIDYRLLQQPAGDINRGIIPAYIDTIAAGEWLRANAARYGIDPDAISVGGVSAGAHERHQRRSPCPAPRCPTCPPGGSRPARSTRRPRPTRRPSRTRGRPRGPWAAPPRPGRTRARSSCSPAPPTRS